MTLASAHILPTLSHFSECLSGWSAASHCFCLMTSLYFDLVWLSRLWELWFTGCTGCGRVEVVGSTSNNGECQLKPECRRAPSQGSASTLPPPQTVLPGSRQSGCVFLFSCLFPHLVTTWPAGRLGWSTCSPCGSNLLSSLPGSTTLPPAPMS